MGQANKRGTYEERQAKALIVQTFPNQRLWDLVRHQRAELHETDLITDEEYAMLAEDHPAVARLETYDSLRTRADAAEAVLVEVRAWRNRQFAGEELPLLDAILNRAEPKKGENK